MRSRDGSVTTQSTVADFEDEGRLQVKDYGQPLEAGEGRETDSPLEPPERNIALQMPRFQPREDCV